jgi:hypothetical protein
LAARRNRTGGSPPPLRTAASAATTVSTNEDSANHSLLHEAPPARGRIFSDWRLRGSSARAAASTEVVKRAELARHARALEKVEAKVKEARGEVQKEVCARVGLLELK